MATIDNKYYDYERMAKIKPLTKFEDIEVGATYHIPPIIIYGRREFTVQSKDYSTVSGIMKFDDGTYMHTTLYRTELSMKYIVRRKYVTKLY